MDVREGEIYVSNQIYLRFRDLNDGQRLDEN